MDADRSGSLTTQARICARISLHKWDDLFGTCLVRVLVSVTVSATVQGGSQRITTNHNKSQQTQQEWMDFMMGPQGLTGWSLALSDPRSISFSTHTAFVFGHVDTSFHDPKTCNRLWFPEHFTFWCSGYADEEDVKVCFFFSLTRPAHPTTALAVVVASSLNYFMPLLFPLLGISGFLWSADKFATQWLASWIPSYCFRNCLLTIEFI